MSPMHTAPAALTGDDEQLRAQYLAEVLSVLYPDSGPAAVEYLVVPNARKPRLLVPADSRRVAAAAVRRYAEPTTRTGRLGRTAIVAALRTGASALLLRDRVRVQAGTDSFPAHLAGVLGDGLALSVHIGPARANRKPVLQVFDARGHTVAFVKLGTNPLTRGLVRAEAAALTTLGHAGLRSITVPKVLHTGQWHDHEVLVLEALPTWRKRVPLTAPRLVTAMTELAGCCGTRRSGLRGSGYASRLRTRLEAVADSPDGRQLAGAAERVLDAAGELRLDFGAWHGDWAPWNMATLDDTLLVWDWERFTPGVPAGFDALHHDLQRRLAAGTDARAAVDAMLGRAGELLRPFGVREEPAAEAIALLYLIDLATRYVADRQAESGARLGVLGRWLLPALLTRVEEL
ncbi:phosphotransferase [Planosporangium mesophilum]|uniref:Aminoglycoside phosphotransferase domain-containing protein n=1 Tax=Planosporangium mesophilum TaxID=689768 RepID=A0A8J3X299_9ACTN|nr:phosphotransferase [Planosporangium mesophilum]NJC84825.1 fructosamine kinase family protein [Planosporangium mesophilum]GII24154.1 hypothetical protein Pme01_37510 [Planosporangium mesophilum]